MWSSDFVVRVRLDVSPDSSGLGGLLLVLVASKSHVPEFRSVADKSLARN